MAAIAAVASQGEMAVREPAQKHGGQLPQQACGGCDRASAKDFGGI
jgi:hypothetical protein